MINTIIFDIGNVLLDFDYMKQFRRLFDEETAQRFRDCILSKGDTLPPMELYRRFRGKDPQVDALLERTGIASNK